MEAVLCDSGLNAPMPHRTPPDGAHLDHAQNKRPYTQQVLYFVEDVKHHLNTTVSHKIGYYGKMDFKIQAVV